uniref:Small integral membrane protein 15 n=1 Tax=Caenorhabditis japonica TaxID=281687 RepID=A0A8R1HQV2_CAEJA
MFSKMSNTFYKWYFLITDHPFFSLEAVAAVVIPLILVAIMFNWRVRQSMKKLKKSQRRRENLLRRLNESRGIKEVDDVEDDEVLKEAVRLMEAKSKKCN